jgi:hypothetical protein
MFRKFKFEEPLYGDLDSIPLSTRCKLDAVGLDLPPAAWKALAREEKMVLCHLSVRSQGEKDCYRGYVLHLLKRLDQSPVFLDFARLEREKSEWENPVRIPREVEEQAGKAGFAISQRDWLKMDDLERYALFKLSASPSGTGPFKAALEEFLPLTKPHGFVENSR